MIYSARCVAMLGIMGLGFASVIGAEGQVTKINSAIVQTCVNIHTTNYPGGEIRGQIVPNN